MDLSEIILITLEGTDCLYIDTRAVANRFFGHFQAATILNAIY